MSAVHLFSSKQISMTAQVIPARTMELAQTKWTDLTAAARQALMEHIVKRVTVTDNISIL